MQLRLVLGLSLLALGCDIIFDCLALCLLKFVFGSRILLVLHCVDAAIYYFLGCGYKL